MENQDNTDIVIQKVENFCSCMTNEALGSYWLHIKNQVKEETADVYAAAWSFLFWHAQNKQNQGKYA